MIKDSKTGGTSSMTELKNSYKILVGKSHG